VNINKLTLPYWKIFQQFNNIYWWFVHFAFDLYTW